MRLKINVHFQTDTHDLDSKWIRSGVESVVKGEGRNADTNINIIFVDDAFIQDMNRTYLKKDRPTDVISFLLEEDVFGEVYVSLDTAQSQSVAYQVSFQEEVARLVIHGVLHLLGYDDNTDDERKIMTHKENIYLDTIVFPVH